MSNDQKPEVKPEYADKEAEMEAAKKEIMEELKKAAGSQKRVETFAKLMDKYGLDPILGLFPALGDAGATGLAGIYLLFEAKRAGLGATSYLKIIGLQVADFFVGAVPLAGDVADYLFKANKWNAKSFEKKTNELVKKAKEMGVSDKDIAKINESAAKLPQLVEKAVGLYGKDETKKAA